MPCGRMGKRAHVGKARALQRAAWRELLTRGVCPQHDAVERLRHRVVQLAGEVLPLFEGGALLNLFVQADVLQGHACLVGEGGDEAQFIVRDIAGMLEHQRPHRSIAHDERQGALCELSARMALWRSLAQNLSKLWGFERFTSRQHECHLIALRTPKEGGARVRNELVEPVENALQEGHVFGREGGGVGKLEQGGEFGGALVYAPLESRLALAQRFVRR